MFLFNEFLARGGIMHNCGSWPCGVQHSLRMSDSVHEF